MRLACRIVTAVLVLGSTAFGFLPIADADSTTTLVPTAWAWYQPNPTCAAPPGCVTTSSVPVPLPIAEPPSPYPAGTLHVGYADGAETARTYLGFPLGSLPGTVTAATLDAPLDTAASDGSLQPETSHLQACLVSAAITPVEGSIAQPPRVSCDQHATLTYVATPAPHLHADLSPLLADLPGASGIALLPDNSKVAQTDDWRAVFSAPGRHDAGKTDPPVLNLTLTPSASHPATPQATPDAAPVGTAGTTVTPGGLPSMPDLGAPSVQPPSIALPQAQPVAQPRTITLGYAYPIVWLLPLCFLALVPMAARALTADLTPLP